MAGERTFPFVHVSTVLTACLSDATEHGAQLLGLWFLAFDANVGLLDRNPAFGC